MTADEPTRAQPPRRPSGAADVGRGVLARGREAWQALTSEQRLAAIAAFALLASMLLPWYQQTVYANGRNGPVSTDESLSAFEVYSFVEAAIFLVAAGVLALLYARGQRKAFHLPGGDGTVVLAGGLWVMLLIFYRQLDKPDGSRTGPVQSTVGVQWGIFIAFLLGALLAYAGYRIRSAHVPEPPPDPDGPEPPDPSSPTRSRAAGRSRDTTATTVAARRDLAGRSTEPTAPERTAPEPASPDAPTTVAPRRRRPSEGDPFGDQLSFDQPDERPPPPREP